MKLLTTGWGFYPRRVEIYLLEKNIDIERVFFDMSEKWPRPDIKEFTPLGTVPVLVTEQGQAIRASLPILEYLEERFPTPNLLGETPEDRARTRELVSVLDEASTYFTNWCKNASPMFAGFVEQSPEAGKAAAEMYWGRQRMVDALMGETDGPFAAGHAVTIADCIAMASLQYVKEMYGVPLPPDCPTLARWYANFSERPSAAVPTYPEQVRARTLGLPAPY